MSHKEIVNQTANAFDFVQKVYFEISYLIKEMEGQLQQEDEQFVIARPSGYGITTKTSTGLEPANVENWIPKTATAFFIPADLTEVRGGQTITPIDERLKILVLHIELINKANIEPVVYGGSIWNVVGKKQEHTKVEKLAWEFAYSSRKIFAQVPDIQYEDAQCSFSGRVNEKKLFDINSSDDVQQKLIAPMLRIYRK